MSASEDELSPDGEDLEIVEENAEPERQDGLIEVTEEAQDELLEVAEEAEEAQGEGNTEEKEVKIKRVRNPQPKLNVERLKGPRGLKALEKIFENVTFKGPKHEEEDLQVMMKHYEYWCHRLFPKFPFDDTLERMERLGNKKPLQVCLKKMRMNMDEPPPPDEIIERNEDDDENEVDDIFDRVAATSAQMEHPANELQLQPPVNEPPVGLTEEQLERIRLNRLKAQKLREQALAKKNEVSETFRSSQFCRNSNSDVDALNDVNFDVTSSQEKSHTETVTVIKDKELEPVSAKEKNNTAESEECYFVSQNSEVRQQTAEESRCFVTTAEIHNEDISDVEMEEVSKDEERVERTEDLDAITVID